MRNAQRTTHDALRTITGEGGKSARQILTQGYATPQAGLKTVDMLGGLSSLLAVKNADELDYMKKVRLVYSVPRAVRHAS